MCLECPSILDGNSLVSYKLMTFLWAEVSPYATVSPESTMRSPACVDVSHSPSFMIQMLIWNGCLWNCLFASDHFSKKNGRTTCFGNKLALRMLVARWPLNKLVVKPRVSAQGLVAEIAECSLLCLVHSLWCYIDQTVVIWSSLYLLVCHRGKTQGAS